MKRLLLLALSALLAGCPKTQDAADVPPPAAESAAESAKPAQSTASKVEFGSPGIVRIAGTLPKYHWQLASAVDAKNQPIQALLVRPALPVTLDFKQGQLAISNTCNRMSGSYAPGGNGVTVGKLASTKMACADPTLMALDQEVGKRLQGKLGLRLSKGDARQLEMTTASGDVLVFASVETADTKHDGPAERVFLEVAAQARPCSHPLMPGKQCLQVREIKYDEKGLKVGTPGEFQHFYDAIDGYTHQPGVRNLLRLNRYTRKDVPADASKYAYVLDMVVESDASTQE